MIWPSLFFNIEGWSNLREADKEKLEVLQGKVLKGLMGLPKSTPYWGILYELDIFPVYLLILKLKLNVYHTLVHSDDERTAKAVIMEQERDETENCWFHDVKMEAKTIGIDLTRQLAETKTGDEWKTMIKTRIREEFRRICSEKVGSMTKLRFLGEVTARQSYILDTFNQSFSDALIIRLNMTEMVAKNYGGNGGCDLCNAEDGTEHVMVCPEVEDPLDVSLIKAGKDMNLVVERFQKMEEKRRELFTENIRKFLLSV